MREKIGKIVDFVHEYLAKSDKKDPEKVWDSKYRWEHTLRVAYWAYLLALEEKADIEKCVVAALFHDVSHFVVEDYRKHGIKSAEIAENFLLKEGYPGDFVEDITYAVKSHVGELNPTTVEAKILQDADTLDRFGYFRILLFGKTAELSDLENLRGKVQFSLEYLEKVEKGDFGPMWTKTGEEKLAKLINANRVVQKGLLEELENTKTPETYLEH